MVKWLYIMGRFLKMDGCGPVKLLVCVNHVCKHDLFCFSFYCRQLNKVPEPFPIPTFRNSQRKVLI